MIILSDRLGPTMSFLDENNSGISHVEEIGARTTDSITSANSLHRQASGGHKKLCRVSQGCRPKFPGFSAVHCFSSATPFGTRFAAAPFISSPPCFNGALHQKTPRRRLETLESDSYYTSSGGSDDGSTGGAISNAVELNKLTLQDSGYSGSLPMGREPSPPLGDVVESTEYNSLLEFALKLGYNEHQLKLVLQRLLKTSTQVATPKKIGQDCVLSELIKLGQENSNPSNFTQLGTGLDPGKTAKNGGVVLKVTFSNPELKTAENNNDLRAIVIDGSNVAITHGHKDIFSCKGIKECVDWFKNRGHADIKVFVPQFRKEASRSDSPITDQHILFELEQQGILIWTPSRRLGGRRIVCHDDRYIVKTAHDKDATIVSNDEYRDIIKESPEYKKVVEERLLMYSFVDGKFMPPDDPLGRYGPKLDQFLRKGSANNTTVATVCPYGRKCTYGNKCKFSHPERPGGLHRSVTDRLKDHADLHRRLSPSNSLLIPKASPNVNTVSTSPKSIDSENGLQQKQSILQQQHNGAVRSQSLNCNPNQKPNNTITNNTNSNLPKTNSNRNFTTTTPPSMTLHNALLISNHRNNVCKQFSSPEQHQHIMLNGRKVPAASYGNGFEPSDKTADSAAKNDNFFVPDHLQRIWHQPIGRNMSEPVNGTNNNAMTSSAISASSSLSGAIQQQQLNPFGAVEHNLMTHRKSSSISDSRLNTLAMGVEPINIDLMMTSSPGVTSLVGTDNGSTVDYCSGQQQQDVFGSGAGARGDWWYSPSSTVWGPLENSSAPIFSSSSHQNNQWPTVHHNILAPKWSAPLLLNPNAVESQHKCCDHWPQQTGNDVIDESSLLMSNVKNSDDDVIDGKETSVVDERRRHLFYHLSKLFPAQLVFEVMSKNGHQTDAHLLCQAILAEMAQNGQKV